jgi:hypothetical protein
MPIRVALGPKSSAASWQWIGEDIAGRLSAKFDVAMFGPESIPAADVLILIKHIPSPAQIAAAQANLSRIVYMPVDHFRDVGHIRRSARFLRACTLIAVHSRALTPYFRGLAPTMSLEHYGKFFLPAIAPYKEQGYALWIGMLEHVPYLLHYLERHPLPLQTKILTNLDSRRAIAGAEHVARQLRFQMHIGDGQINGIEAYPWSADLQARMLSEAKAAIDIKGRSFNQRMKPPTKAQQFVCSGVPLAMTPCGITRYMEMHGLRIPLPSDDRWLTRSYYENVCSVARRLRPKLTLDRTADRMSEIIERVARQR